MNDAAIITQLKVIAKELTMIRKALEDRRPTTQELPDLETFFEQREEADED